MSRIYGLGLFYLLLFVTSCTSTLDPLFEFEIAPNISIKTIRLDDTVGQIAIQFSLQKTPLKQGDFLIIAQLLNEQGRAESFSRSLQHFSPRSDTTFTLALTPIAMPSTWSETNPKIYTLNIKIMGKDNQVLTQVKRPFAFKKIRFESTGFYLNGVQTPIEFEYYKKITSPLEKNKIYLISENTIISQEKWLEFSQQFIKVLLPISALENPLENTQAPLMGYYTSQVHSIPKSSSFPIQVPLLFVVKTPLKDSLFYEICKQVDAIILTDTTYLSSSAQKNTIRPIFKLKNTLKEN